MSLELAYADGQLAALTRYKLGWPAPTNPTVAGSGVLRAKSTSPTLTPEAQQNLAAPTSPHQIAQIFSAHEQGQSRSEPLRKLSADLCTTCRKEKHYGPCSAPRKIPAKVADFNAGMLGSDPSQQNSPSTSPHYHSATTADSALARSRDGRPADEQAASGFADLFRHQGIRNSADEPGRMTGGLHKVADAERTRRHALLFKMFGIDLSKPKQAALGLGAIQYFAKGLGPEGGAAFLDKHHYRQQGIPQNFRPSAPVAREQPMTASMPLAHGPSSKVIVDPSLFHPAAQHKVARKLADFMLPGSEGHSMHEQRGPSVNPYEERRTRMSPPVGWGDEGEQRIHRAFNQIDNAADTTNIGGGFGDPQPGPAALG